MKRHVALALIMAAFVAGILVRDFTQDGAAVCSDSSELPANCLPAYRVDVWDYDKERTARPLRLMPSFDIRSMPVDDWVGKLPPNCEVRPSGTFVCS